jgi:DNA-binding LacI/PurR family transcriptional regulator
VAELKRKVLHERLADRLRREIRRDWSPGQKFNTELKLADRFDVSVGTVRQAVLTLCNEGLLRRRQGAGTFVCRTAGAHQVAILTSSRAQEPGRSVFFPRLADALRRRLDAESLACRNVAGTCQAGGAETATARSFAADVEAGRISGALGVGISLRDWLQELLAQNEVPLVGASSKAYSYRVRIDQEEMVRQGVRFLLGRGRRKLALLHPADHGPGRREKDPHVRAFREELGAAEVEFRQERVFTSINPTSAGSGWSDFADLWGNPALRPDALLVCDDCLFRDAAPMFLARGIRMPHDLLVATHANRGTEMVYPFPTVRMEYDPREFADAMMEMLLQLMGGDEPEEQERRIEFRWRGIDEVDRALREGTKEKVGT